MLLIPKRKSCGCLIASNIVSLEIQRRKEDAKIRSIKEKLKKTSHKIQVKSLESKERKLRSRLLQVNKHQKMMKKRFKKYEKESGYVPPKLKKRW